MHPSSRLLGCVPVRVRARYLGLIDPVGGAGLRWVRGTTSGGDPNCQGTLGAFDRSSGPLAAVDVREGTAPWMTQSRLARLSPFSPSA